MKYVLPSCLNFLSIVQFGSGSQRYDSENSCYWQVFCSKDGFAVPKHANRGFLSDKIGFRRGKFCLDGARGAKPKNMNVDEIQF